MKKIIIALMLLSLDVFAGPQAFIISRHRATSRMSGLYSRELPSSFSRTYDNLRNFENASGGDSFRRSREENMKRRCFNLGDKTACDYVRNYL
jgi:hypothetical protein